MIIFQQQNNPSFVHFDSHFEAICNDAIMILSGILNPWTGEPIQLSQLTDPDRSSLDGKSRKKLLYSIVF